MVSGADLIFLAISPDVDLLLVQNTPTTLHLGPLSLEVYAKALKFFLKLNRWMAPAILCFDDDDQFLFYCRLLLQDYFFDHEFHESSVYHPKAKSTMNLTKLMESLKAHARG